MRVPAHLNSGGERSGPVTMLGRKARITFAHRQPQAEFGWSAGGRVFVKTPEKLFRPQVAAMHFHFGTAGRRTMVGVEGLRGGDESFPGPASTRTDPPCMSEKKRLVSRRRVTWQRRLPRVRRMSR